jgi:2-alkyl-3-oxoalkanoate reductase
VKLGRILLTGASGFIGSHVLNTLRRRMPGAQLRVLTHRTPLSDAGGALEPVAGDLGRPESLAGVCEGVDGVIHAAAHIGDDPAECELVNGSGTEALMQEARRAGVRRILYFSNAAVYGWAEHFGSSESAARPAPVTPVSRSRVRAERAVLSAGGVVLRPLFVYGEGDTRFIPAIIRAMQNLPFMVDHGRARLSVVTVDALAEAAAGMLGVEAGADSARVFHVSEPEPVTFKEIAGELARHFALPFPKRSLPYPLARWTLRLGSRWRAAGIQRTESAAHRLFLVSRDHFYDATRLRDTLGWQPSHFSRQFPAYLSWYWRFIHPRYLRSMAN